MLPNPFTPSRIANKPQEFFGREAELFEVPRVIRQGSIVIDGPIGIGKSSLASQIMLEIESSNGKPALGTVYSMICSRSMKTPEDVAARLLAELTESEERTKKTKFLLPKFFEIEYTKANKPADVSRSLRVIRDLLAAAAAEHDRLIVVVLDEADKCASAIAQFMRIILTGAELDQSGLDRIRFIISGISPFYSEMIREDAGIARFVYQRYSLTPFGVDEAIVFLEQKFRLVLDSEDAVNMNLQVDDALYEHIARVTGGHPHLLQLVGSYVIDHEESNPDTFLDKRDLVGCFNRVCFQTRGPVYEQMLHGFEADGHLESLKMLFSAAESKCPTIITTKRASDVVENEVGQYFIAKGLLSFDSALNTYRLNDEFLRIRMLLDDPTTNPRELEKALLRKMRQEEATDREQGHGYDDY
jgi:hypothetical protein